MYTIIILLKNVKKHVKKFKLNIFSVLFYFIAGIVFGQFAGDIKDATTITIVIFFIYSICVFLIDLYLIYPNIKKNG
jgi:ABC-type dipeptide/oligopeptide/nickel transport system permease component